MGRSDKRYYKDLHQQAYDKLKDMMVFGQSRKADKEYDREHGTDTVSGKIYSSCTYETYKQHINQYLKWLKINHPQITTLKKARKYVPEWLQSLVDGGKLSAWTISTKAASLNKLFGIKEDDPDRFHPPQRHREDIKRSRTDAVRDKHFSKTNNDELIKFCQGTGLRRKGMESIRGKDLMTREQIEAEISRIENIPEENRTREDRKNLTICKDTRVFTKPDQEYFVHVKEKGGRERISPIIGPNTKQIVERFRRTAPEDKVWKYVNSNADIHSYRADYALELYKQYARRIEDIPYDRVNRGTGRKYQSEVYVCRKDERGKRLDKCALQICSKALGHNRINIVPTNYLRGL